MPTIQTQSANLQIDKHPDECPICNHSLVPQKIGASVNGPVNQRGTYLDVAYKCVRHECGRVFLSVYQRRTSQGDEMVRDFNFLKSLPLTLHTPEFPEEIVGISNSFVEIFSQAHIAEHHGLDQIAGVGYRLSLIHI